MVHQAREHAGARAAQRQRIDPGPLQRLPRRLQQQPLLRIHRERLTRGDPEQLRVELGRVVQEAPLAGGGAARALTVQGREVPATVRREARHAVTAGRHQVPQRLRRVHSARETAPHPDDRDGLVGAGRGAGGRGREIRRAEEFCAEVGGEGEGAGVVEDEGGGELEAGDGLEAVAEVYGGQGVEAEVLEGACGFDGRGAGVAEDCGDRALDEVEQEPVLFVAGQGEQAAGQGVAAVGAGGGLAASGGQQAVQDGGGGVAVGGEGRRVEREGQGDGVGAVERGVEEGEGLVGGQRREALTAQASDVGLSHTAAHAVGRLPHAPCQGQRGQALGAAGGGEGVEHGVGGGVGGLAAVAEDAGDGGEQDEGVHVLIGRQLVQVPGGGGLGVEDAGESFGREVGQEPVVEHSGRVDHAAEPYAVQGGGQGTAVGGVAGDDPGAGTGCAELGDETLGSRGFGAPAGHEQQVAYAVGGDQVPGDDGAEAAGAARDEDGPGLRPGGGLGGRRFGGAGDTRQEDLLAAHDELVGVEGGQGGDEGAPGLGGAVGVGDGEAAGVFVGGGAQQAPYGGARGVGGVVAGRSRGDRDQAGVGEALVGEPCVQGGQDIGGCAGAHREENRRRVRRGEGVEGATGDDVRPRGRVAGQYGRDAAAGRREADRRPLQPEEAARARCVVAQGRQRPQDEALGFGDGRACLVRRVQGDGVVGVPGEPYAQGRGTDGVQAYAAPQERQPCLVGGVVRQGEGVQGGVEEGRVQAVRRGVRGAVRQGGLDEDAVAVPPCGGEAAERGAVVETDCGQPVVQAVQREGFGSGGRPGPQVPGRGGTRGGEGAGGVQCPRRVGGCAVGACVDADGAAAVGRGGFDGDLEVCGAVLGQHERGVQGEFGEGAAARLVAGLHGEFDERGAGDDDSSGDGVVGEPGVGVGRQGRGEQDGVGAGGAQGGAEQGVADAAETEAADVGDGSGGP